MEPSVILSVSNWMIFVGELNNKGSIQLKRLAISQMVINEMRIKSCQKRIVFFSLFISRLYSLYRWRSSFDFIIHHLLVHLYLIYPIFYKISVVTSNPFTRDMALLSFILHSFKFLIS